MRVVASDDRSIVAVVGAIVDNIQTLLRTEARLVTTEVLEEVGKAARPVGRLALGAALGFYGLGLFLMAGVVLLSRHVQVWAAAAIIGTVVVTAAAGLVYNGLRVWKRIRPAPEATAQSSKENWTWNPPARHSQPASQRRATS